MVNTTGSIANVSMLMFLIIYIYSVIGITLFANVKGPEESRLGFKNFGNAFFSLIVVASGEDWD